MFCVLCLYVIDGEAEKAITVIDGNASCNDHMGYLTGRGISEAIMLYRREHGQERKVSHAG
jgi:hypothetical protein